MREKKTYVVQHNEIDIYMHHIKKKVIIFSKSFKGIAFYQQQKLLAESFHFVLM